MELTKERKRELNKELHSLDRWSRKKICGEEDSKIRWLWFGIIFKFISIICLSGTLVWATLYVAEVI